MVALEFTLAAAGATAAEAFAVAVNDAARQHGFNGHTGTIAEKTSFEVFLAPAGVAATDVCAAVAGEEFDLLSDWLGRTEALRILVAFANPDGPAVCVPAAPGVWCFCGLADF